MNPLDTLTQMNQQKQVDSETLAKHNDLLNSNTQVQETIVKSTSLLVDFLSQHVSKTQVVNQLTEIGTPDAMRVVEAVNDLHETLRTHENTDLTQITEVMQGVLDEVKQLPKDQIEIPEAEAQIDYSDRFTSLEEAVKAVTDAVKAQETTVDVKAPVVNVPETSVNVEAPDLTPLSKDLQAIKKAIKDTVYPTFDATKLEKEQVKQTKILEKILDKPVGGGGGGSSWTAINEDGVAQPLELLDGALRITGSITASASTLADFSVNDIEEDTTSYFGSTKPDGTWLVKSLTATSVAYATVSNNGTVTSYTDAWTDRATLTYGRFDEAF